MTPLLQPVLQLRACRSLPQYAKVVISSVSRRHYATPRQTSSSLLAQGLNRTSQNNTTSNLGSTDSVGPFPIGIQPLNFRNQDKVKPWNELSPRGKVFRTAARGSNLTVILVGAGLSVVLTYALATELFAKNSPTVLYGQACDLITASEPLGEYLPGPISFHTTPPSLVPTRHRNRHAQYHLAEDSNGAEHLLLHFWITSSHLTDAQAPSASWSEWLRSEWDFEWNADRLSDAGEYVKGKATEAWDSAKQAVAFVSGIPIQPSLRPVLAPSTALGSTSRSQESDGWSFVGLFRNMKLKGASPQNRNLGLSSPTHQWDSAEVHADFVKDKDGVFQYRYLLVDLPNSRVRNPVRIVIKRGYGYSDRDGVFQWQ